MLLSIDAREGVPAMRIPIKHASAGAALGVQVAIFVLGVAVLMWGAQSLVVSALRYFIYGSQ